MTACEDCEQRLCFTCATKVRPSDLGRVSYLELVDRLTAETRRAVIAEQTVRDLLEGDKVVASYILLLQARVAVMEQNQERLLAERGKAA